jgi:hypothetical protein
MFFFCSPPFPEQLSSLETNLNSVDGIVREVYVEPNDRIVNNNLGLTPLFYWGHTLTILTTCYQRVMVKPLLGDIKYK